MEDQLADSFFGFDATLSGSPDDANDETEDGQDEEFYDALNEETFGTDAVEGDWEEDHEKLAEITELARVRSNSYNGIEERYNENGADIDSFGGGESDLADSISRMVFEDQEETFSTDPKVVRSFQMEAFDGSYSSSAPSGFSLWSNGGLAKGQHQPLMTVPAASGTIWDPAVLQSSPSASQKESGNVISNIMNVRTVKDLECHLLHKRGANDSEQSAPSPSASSAALAGPLPKPSAAWLLEDIERELTSTSVPSPTTSTPTSASTAPTLSSCPSTQSLGSMATTVSMARTYPVQRHHSIQRSLPHHIPHHHHHHQHPPNMPPPPPHSFHPGSLPPSMLPSQQTAAPPISLVDMAMRQIIQPPLAAMAQNQRLMGTGGPANMLLFMSKDGAQQRGDASKGFLDAMRGSERLGSRVPHPNHLHQAAGMPNYNHPVHIHHHRIGPDFVQPHGYPPSHGGGVGQIPRFPHPPFSIPGQPLHHRGFFGGRQGNSPGSLQQFHHHHHHPPSYHQQNSNLQHLHHLNGSEDWDEYAGLMTQWEKQFLLNIQRMQLQSDRPYVDDYYYTMYARRKKERETSTGGKGSGHSALNVLLERERHLREKDNKSGRTEHHKYTPAQFENSLGKLQVVSVMAPRKIIDLDMTPPEKIETGSQLTARDSRRIKLEIERLYTFLLQIEDLEVPWIEKQDLTTTENKEELVAKMLSSLHQEEKLAAILCFRKGKMLLVRLLPHVAPALQTQLWTFLFRSLPSVIRKDSVDGCLTLLIPYFQKWASAVGPVELSQAVSALIPNSSMAHSRSPSPLVSSKSPLALVLGNKFGISSVATIVERIAELQSKGALDEGDVDGGGDRTELLNKYGLWTRFLDCLADAAAAVPEAATTFKGSILSQHRLSSTPKGLGNSPSPTLPTLPEGESWTIPVERFVALSKALHRLDEDVVAPRSAAKVSADS